MKELIQRCISKDQKAQRQLFEKYAPILLGIAMRYSSSREEAQDILQDSFLKIFSNISAYSEKGSFEGWMKRIVINTAINYFNTNKKFTPHHDIENITEVPFNYNEAIEKISTEELFEAIKSLPEGYKMVLNLYAIEGYSHKEISEMLNISEGTSKSQLSRARVLLNDILNGKKIFVL